MTITARIKRHNLETFSLTVLDRFSVSNENGKIYFRTYSIGYNPKYFDTYLKYIIPIRNGFMLDSHSQPISYLFIFVTREKRLYNENDYNHIGILPRPTGIIDEELFKAYNHNFANIQIDYTSLVYKIFISNNYGSVYDQETFKQYLVDEGILGHGTNYDEIIDLITGDKKVNFPFHGFAY
jgi:hypothetical protein